MRLGCAVAIIAFCGCARPVVAGNEVIATLAFCHDVALPTGSPSDLNRYVSAARFHRAMCKQRAIEACTAGTNTEACLSHVAGWYEEEAERRLRNLPDSLTNDESLENKTEYAAFLASGPADVTIFADPCERLDGTAGPTRSECALRDAVLAFGQVADWQTQIEYWTEEKE